MKHSRPRLVAAARHVALDIYFVELKARLVTRAALASQFQGDLA